MTTPKPAETYVPWRAVLTRQFAGALLITCLGVWLHATDSLLVATMLPVIVAEIGGLHLIAWVVMLYEVGTIVAGAACGLLVARRGLRNPMALAAVVFAAGCAVSALAQTMPVLLWGRLLQGLGGGGLMAMAFVAAGLLFPLRLQARVIGLVSTVWAASSFSGPLIGGLFVEYLTWQTAFWVFTALALGLAALIVWLNPKIPPQATGDAGFPIRRLALLLCGVMAIAYGGEDVNALTTPLWLAAGAGLMVGFVWLDGRSTGNRLLPRLDARLRDPVTAGLATICLFAGGTIAIGTFAPYFLGLLHGLSPLAAGALIAVEAIGWATTAMLVSGLPEHRDPRTIALGLGIVALGVVGLAATIASGPIALIVLFALMQGVGFGTAWTFMMRRAAGLSTLAERPLVAAAIPTVQRIGYAIGAALMGIVANASGIDGETPGWAATVIFASAIPVIFLGLWTLQRFLRG